MNRNTTRSSAWTVTWSTVPFQRFTSKVSGRAVSSPNSNIMPPMAKRSKRAQREHYAAKRGSWNGLSPITRVVQSKKTYDRNRMKREARRANDI